MHVRVKHSINRLFLSRGEHFRNWHIWSISNGSQNNSSTRSQRVSIPRTSIIVVSATITRVDIFDLSLMVLKIIQVKFPAGFHSSTSFCHISNNNSRSMHVRVKHSINRLFLSRGEHFRNWHIWSISNGSQNNSSTRSQRVSIPRHL